MSPVNEIFRNSRGARLLFDDAFQDDDGSIWFLQRQGIVFRFEPETEKLRLFAVPNWIILDWIRDKRGSIWFGCANGNTWRLMMSSLHYQSFRVPNMFNVANYNNPRIAEDNNKRVWLALSTGIYNSDFNEDLDFSPEQIRLPTGDTVVNCIIKDRKGNLWASLAETGYFDVNSTDNSYKTLYIPENIEDIVYNIIEDKSWETSGFCRTTKYLYCMKALKKSNTFIIENED